MSRFEDLADHVNRLLLRLVVGARLHLGQQAERDQLHTGENQENREQQQRPVGNRLAGADELDERQPRGSGTPGRGSR